MPVIDLRIHRRDLQVISLLLAFFLFTSVIPLDQKQLSSQSATEDDASQVMVPSNIDVESLDFPIQHLNGSFEGYTIVDISQYKDSIVNNTIIIIDMDGNIVNQLHIGQIIAFKCIVSLVNPYTALIGTPNGPIFWNFINNTIVPASTAGGHHELEYNANSNTFFTFRQYTTNIEGEVYLYDVIVELDNAGNIVWSLDTSDFIPTSWWCPYHDYAGGYRDITHSNTIFYDADDDVIYYNSRNTNTIFKINHTSSEVIWALGEHGDFALYDIYGSPVNSLFYHAHSIEPLSENTFIIFNNDYHDQENPEVSRSEIQEFEINEDNMTAHETFRWSGSNSHFSAGWGDADRLPNGNRLGTFGYWGASVPALIEVTPDGEVVWEFDFPKEDGAIYGTYRAERFLMAPLLDSPADVFVSVDTDVSLSWNAWYNFRTRETIEGTYNLYVNDVVVDSSSFNFRKYWQASTLTQDLGILPEGEYNVTLEIVNDVGQRAVDSVTVQVGPVHVTRSGPTQIEYGQSNSSIIWSGYATYPVYYNLSVDGALLRSEAWDESDIVLDLNTLSIGSHHVVLQIFNATYVHHTDDFWAHVYESSPPEITNNNTNLILDWNESYEFTWILYDMTPWKWEILINSTVSVSSIWVQKNITLNWDLPALHEGLYNITMVAYDRANHISVSTTFVKIIPPSIPVIVSLPSQKTVEWGTENFSLTWEVHGISNWTLLKDNVLFDSMESDDTFVTITIDSWQTRAWIPDKYNLTLLVSNDMGMTVSKSFMLNVVLNQGDPYGDYVISSHSYWVEDGNYSLGAPDGQSACIFEEYGPGYLTIDMGEGEEIIDGPGEDFSIIVSGGTYMVYVGNDLSSPFESIGTYSGNCSIDLSQSDFDTVRYVQVIYFSGDSVYVDAVVANYFNSPTSEGDAPTIYGPTSYVISLDSFIVLNWSASDRTPWNYTILVNGMPQESGLWFNENISYVFYPSDLGDTNITLIVSDIFGNVANHSVLVHVVIPFPVVAISVLAVGGVGCLVVLYYVKRIRK